MNFKKITEAPSAEALDSAASFLVTQPADHEGVTEESLRRIAIAEMVEKLADEFGITLIEEKIEEITNYVLNKTDTTVEVQLSYLEGYYTHEIGSVATFVGDSNRACAIVPVSVGDKHLLTTRIGSNTIAGIIYLDVNGVVIAYDLLGDGKGVVDYPDYETIAPDSSAFLIVSSADGRTAYRPKLKKVLTSTSAKAYSKEESDERFLRKNDSENLVKTISEIKERVLVETETTEAVELSYEYGYYTYEVGKTASFVSDSSRASATVPVTAGDKHLLTTRISANYVACIIYLNVYGKVVSFDLVGSGYDTVDYSDYETIAPEYATNLIVASADSRAAYLPKLKKCIKNLSAAAYCKEESDARYKPISASDGIKKYGVKYAVNNPDDLGTRCFDAVGLTAEIGIGATDGHSDFDDIYPWSEMKRCNISVNASGAKIVTFEGESGFALDGSNGDVFVRIPKFCFERYTENGYEYIVISESGRSVHPAFVESGREIDEIFVSAFEGVILDNKLHSIGGVIPSSNQTGATFLNAAVSNGSGYTLYDMRCVSAIWALMAVEFGCRNSNQILGYGASDYLQAKPQYASLNNAEAVNSITVSKLSPGLLATLEKSANIVICRGNQSVIVAERKMLSCISDSTTTTVTFDGDPIDVTTEHFVGSAALCTNWCEDAPSGSLSWHTGRPAWVTGDKADMYNPVRYRWIENILGNLWHLMPDVRFNNGQMYQAKNIADYDLSPSIPSTYEPVGAVYPEQINNSAANDTPNASYWISKLSNNHFAAGILFGAGFDMSQTSKSGFGGHYYLMNDGIRHIANGGGFDHRYCNNILTHRAWIRHNTTWFLYGARLLYKAATGLAGR